jgi:hypothetical protein
MLAIANGHALDQARQINIFRFLLHQCDLMDGFENPTSPLIQYQLLSTLEDESLKWLWNNISAAFEHDDVVRIRCHLLQAFVYNITGASSSTQEQARINQVIELMDSEILQRYLQGEFSLLEPFFKDGEGFSSCDSQRYARIFFDLLDAWDVEIQTFRACEQKILSTLFWTYASMFRKRKIVFEDQGDSNRLLYWVWDLDTWAPGYTLVSEHMGLGPDSGWHSPIWYGEWLLPSEHLVSWPFSESDARFDMDERYIEGTHWESRFNRREANKARKERAQTGQKGSRRMPGAWVW